LQCHARVLQLAVSCTCPATPRVPCCHLLQLQVRAPLRTSNATEKHSQLTALNFIVLCFIFLILLFCCFLCFFLFLLFLLLFYFCCFYVLLLFCFCCFSVFAVFTLDVGLLARSQYSEGPATGHFDTSFSWFPCVYKQMLRCFPRFQVATTCFSCSPSDLNLLVTNFIFCMHVK